MAVRARQFFSFKHLLLNVEMFRKMLDATIIK